MELTVPLIKTKISGGVERKAYTADAQTISDLSLLVSSKIYTDNVMAVIREISCNAYDANLDSNSTIPFKVTLPCYSQGGSPYIEWRDYGLGLSEEDVNSIFTNLVRSTKRNKKNPIGCFGVGSKSPFSYCNNFSVSSFQNGIVTHYSMQKDSSGFSFFKMGTSKTEEMNGLKIKVPVKYKDIEEFRVKAIYYFSLWKEKDLPIIENLSEKIKFRLVKVFEYNDFVIYKNEKESYDFTVLMGNVLYSVNRSELEQELKDFDLSAYSGVTIEVPLGYFSPAISRESLDYNEYTISQFNKFFREAKEQVTSYLKNKIDDYPNFETAYRSILILRKMGLVNEDLEYKGFSLSSCSSFKERTWPLYLDNFRKNIIGPPPSYSSIVERSAYCFQVQSLKKSYTSGKISLKSISFEEDYYFSVNANEKHCFYLMDCEFKYKKDYNAFFAFLCSRFGIYDFCFFKDIHNPIIEKAKKYYGSNNVRIRSINRIYKRLFKEYEESKKIKKIASQKRVFSGVEILDTSETGDFPAWAKDKSVDLSSGGFYINTKCNEYDKILAKKVVRVINFFNLVGEKNKIPTIYGFKHKCLSSKNFINNEDKWVFKEKIIPSLFDLLKTNDKVFYCYLLKANGIMLETFFKGDFNFIEKLVKVLSELIKSNFKNIDKYKKILSYLNIILSVREIYDYFYNLNIPSEAFSDLFKVNNSRRVEVKKLIEGSYFKKNLLGSLFENKDHLDGAFLNLEKLGSEDLSLVLLQRELDKIK